MPMTTITTRSSTIVKPRRGLGVGSPYGEWEMGEEKVDFGVRKSERKLKPGFNFGWPLEREREY